MPHMAGRDASHSSIIRFASLTPRPWLNGQGHTTTILQDPPLASPDQVHWRVSSAELRGPSTFSDFSGYRRWFAPLTVGPIRLRINGQEQVLEQYDVCTFLGSDRVDCDPGVAVGHDLNLMVRGSNGEMRCEVLSAGEHREIEAGGTSVVIALEGEAAVEGDTPGAPPVLGRLDALLLPPSIPGTVRATAGAVTLMLLRIGDATHAGA